MYLYVEEKICIYLKLEELKSRDMKGDEKYNILAEMIA